MRNWILLFAVLGLLAVFGCGGGGGAAPNLPVSVSLPSNTANLPVGGTQTFTPTVKNTTDAAVSYSIQEGAAGGSITIAGAYTAPNLAGTYHILITSQADTSKTFTVTVTVHLTVAFTSTATPLTLNQMESFTVAVAGTTNTTINWSVQEGAAGGSVTAAGVYTAPNAPGTYHLVATAAADPTQSAVIAITVQAGTASGTVQ